MNEHELRNRARSARLACALSATVLLAVALSSGAQHRQDRARIERLEARSAALFGALAESESARDAAHRRADELRRSNQSLLAIVLDRGGAGGRVWDENVALRAANRSLQLQLRRFEPDGTPRVAPPKSVAVGEGAPQSFCGVR